MKELLTDYQKKVFSLIKNGSKLQSTEGEEYKCFLIHKNGDKENIKTKTAESICEVMSGSLVFGEKEGIRYRV